MSYSQYCCNRNITISDLAIPDTYCSPRDKTGYSCPRAMKCVALDLTRSERGFSGFDEFGRLLLAALSCVSLSRPF